ncbi:structure-specific endonuclease subunit SLX4 isoform X3 [Candoia aspera]|uniref:structure-specific endonuclease subunit SLX4 isoform X3 n=1 Tax=Candoia aspera TaxID=51853 RepID=UPI002FD7F33C
MNGFRFLRATLRRPARGFCNCEAPRRLGAARPPGALARLHRACAAVVPKMGDSEDEFRLLVPPGRRRGAAPVVRGECGRPGGERGPLGAAGAAPGAGPLTLLVDGGRERDGAPSAARPAGRKRRKAAAAGELLTALAMSRSGAGPGGKRPRAEKRDRGKPPPPLLLQGPEEARRGLEARAALLLSEAPAAPCTPPLPTSRWREAAVGSLAEPEDSRCSLWELSSLTGRCAPDGVAAHWAEERREFSMSAALPESGRSPEVEHFPSRICGYFQENSPGHPKKLAHQRDADTLQDLLELAGEGLTLTQWNLDIRQLERPEQEQKPGVLQNTFIRLLQQQQQQQQLSQKRSCETVRTIFPLDSLAAAFKEMVNNPHLSDIQIQVDSGEILYAHMFVLYARCPQLLQFVGHRSFVVAEDGEVRACRVLLHDTPREAVALFLNYLYTAEHFIPQHLLSDVADLAIRFGVKELAVLCEGQPSEGICIEKSADDKDRPGTFEELLKSMWPDEDEETAPKSVRRDEISDSMNDQELEEIYTFVATQRRMTPDEVRNEKVCVECRHDEGEEKIGQDGASCPRKVLEKSTRGMTIRKVKPDNGPCARERDVVVVDDSEEEQEVGPPFSRGIFAEPLEMITVNARNPLGTSVDVFDVQDNNPVTVGSSIANSAATFHSGVGDLLLHNSQNWSGEDSDSSEVLPVSQSLSASIPVPKISDLTCQAREISCITPQMSFPPYSSMDTPELKKELSRFGVRALPKQQMVLKLKEIFKFTHQQAGTNSKKKAVSVATSSFQKLQQKFVSPYLMLQGSQNTNSFTDISEGGNQRPEAGFGWPKGATVPANRLTIGGGTGDLILTASQESAGSSGAGSETCATSQSSSTEFEISMLAEKEEDVPASQIAETGEVRKLEILKHYIHSNPSLCQQILLYQPIELSVLHAELKENGIRIALDKLLDFLDANCITFTTAEARREKKQHLHRSKKKGRR